MATGTKNTILAAALVATAACATTEEPDHMREMAESYVKLVLSVGEHDADYVDAYYGPEEWREDVRGWNEALPLLAARATVQLEHLETMADPADEFELLRLNYLRTQTRSVVARIAMLQGQTLSFDEESRALYDAVAPINTEEHFEEVLRRLETELPGSGSLAERYNAFRSRFVIPTEALDTVFRTAIDACRARTAEFMELPEGESFVVEYVTDKSWSGYNWYQGNYQSLIQVNTDFPIYIDRAIDLACHEGYPGHHVYNAMLEYHLVNGRGWPEFSVYPLFSPQSLIAEGSANFGIEVAFPGDERIAFESEFLFPLAGIDPTAAVDYYRVQELVAQLSYAGNEAARRYLDGEIDAGAAALWLQQYAMFAPDRAEQRVRFIDQYRSYVINYNLGQDLVRAYVDGNAVELPRAARWERFKDLLASPRLPGDL